MITRFGYILVVLTVSTMLGCSTMTPARYSVSVDNLQILKKFEKSKAYVVSVTPPASYDSNCRLMGPIEASDGMTIPQFVQKAFNDEFKFAGIHSENNGVALSGTLNKIEFSSMSSLTDGWWDLDLTLVSSNGKSMNIASRYDFKSGFDAITGCNQTAQALGPAVQDLIRKTIVHPQFGALIAATSVSNQTNQNVAIPTNTAIPIAEPAKPVSSPEIPTGQRVALIIGNAGYKELPLKNPLNDAKDIAETLRNLKFEVIEIQDSSKRSMLDAIDTFEKRLQQAKIGLFYYSGHGMQYQGNNYLIPIRAEITSPADLEQEAIDARRILGRMEHSPTELNVIVLDACRDNPFSKLSGFRSFGNRGFAVLPQVRGALLAYSTQPDNVAADGTGRNSPYTKYLLQHLEQQPHLSVTDLFNEVGRSVLQETNGKQAPWVSSSPLPRFCFAGCN